MIKILSKLNGSNLKIGSSYTLETEREYRRHEALSQSTVKPILSNEPYVLNRKRKRRYARGFAIGSVVDFFLTRYNIDVFDLDGIKILKEDKPSGLLGKTIDYLLQGYSIEQAHKLTGWKKDSLETIKKRVARSQYYWDMLLPETEMEVTEADYITSKKVYKSMMTNKYTKWYCQKGKDDVQELYQLAIVFSINGIKTKALLDKVFVNHKTKKVLPIDFKTTINPTTRFYKAFYEYKYDVQAAWYTLACQSYFKGYKIEPFQFVVESTKFIGRPLVWKVKNKTLKEGYKKIDSILQDYQWYEQNGFQEPRYIVEANGILEI